MIELGCQQKYDTPGPPAHKPQRQSEAASLGFFLKAWEIST